MCFRLCGGGVLCAAWRLQAPRGWSRTPDSRALGSVRLCLLRDSEGRPGRADPPGRVCGQHTHYVGNLAGGASGAEPGSPEGAVSRGCLLAQACCGHGQRHADSWSSVRSVLFTVCFLPSLGAGWVFSFSLSSETGPRALLWADFRPWCRVPRGPRESGNPRASAAAPQGRT